jgi:hypothetical protein
MEVFKIKISPEVLRNELTTQSYSGVSFGYYSGLSYVLSAGTTNLGTWTVGLNGVNPGNFGGASILSPLGPNTEKIYINEIDSSGFNWKSYLLNIKIGSLISITADSGELYQFRIILPSRDIIDGLGQTLELSVEPVNVTSIIPIGISVNLTITQPNTSQLIDLSVPILLKQDYEDLGYYSPFDGLISQLSEEVNFVFTANTENPFDVLIYNTSISGKTYLQNSTFIVNWGDDTPIENVEVVVPESLLHTYIDVGLTTGYTITFTGYTSIGSYVVKKNITLPYSQAPITNPFGAVEFQPGNFSWSTTPSSQDFITTYDSENTVADQVSSNFVSVPFIVSGFTESRLEELKIYGPNPYVTNLTINLADGTTGVVTSQSPEYTAYTINDQSYLDFSAGTSVFVAQSYGLTDNTLTATSITKLEYLMNVIDQPIIQSNVFIERGKISGMENFRRIGEINNTGSLSTYGYKFFDVRNYDDI